MSNKRGRSNKKLIIGIVLIAVISVVMISASGLLQIDWSQETEAGSTFAGTITAYKDGEPVSEPILMGSFMEGDNPIDEFRVRIYWTSTGTSIDWDTFSLAGDFKVSRLWDDGEHNPRYVTTYITDFTSGDEDGEWLKTLVLGTDVCKLNTIQDGGWRLLFEIDLTASVEDTLGQVLTEDLRFTGVISITYVSDFGIQGGWSTH